MSTISPCKGCEERTAEPNCHGICEKYLTWQREHKEDLDRKYEIKRQEGVITEAAIDHIRRCRKKRHGRK